VRQRRQLGQQRFSRLEQDQAHDLLRDENVALGVSSACDSLNSPA